MHYLPTPSFWAGLVVEAQRSSSSRALAAEIVRAGKVN